MTKEFLWDNYRGKNIYAYTISDVISVTVCNLGATVLSIQVPDQNGNLVDVALGMTNANDVVERGDYMGAVVGRCGNRIANGRFCLSGKTYQLDCNNGKAHLHGGYDGFNRKVWTASAKDNSVTFCLHSPNGDQGYPNAVDVSVTYTVSGSTLCIDYSATSDGITVFNPTNHTYFNLNGEFDGSIYDNVVQIFADKFLPVDENLIPCGEQSVVGTPFDFTLPKPIGQDIGQADSQLHVAGGYDHNFCLNGRHAMCAYSPKTGIQMDVFTDRKGMQFYTGNFLVGNVGKSVYPKRSGFCAETQCYPDAVNHADYPSVVLDKGERFVSQTQFVFGLKSC